MHAAGRCLLLLLLMLLLLLLLLMVVMLLRRRGQGAGWNRQVDLLHDGQGRPSGLGEQRPLVNDQLGRRRPIGFGSGAAVRWRVRGRGVGRDCQGVARRNCQPLATLAST
jgi:hypothetical protein